MGILFILAGIAYGSLVSDAVYDKTFGWLIANNWVSPPPPENKEQKPLLGRKASIIMYSMILILIGLFILWKL